MRQDTRLWKQAMVDSDNWVVRVRYMDSKSQTTIRLVSPIRWVGRDKVLVMCLGRTEPRLLKLDRCSDLELVPASDVLMPMPISTVKSDSEGSRN